MATLLRQDLEKADARRRSDTLDFMARITDDRRAATAQVRASLSDLASGRSEMATLLRQDLARGLAALGKADARRRSDTLDFMARITDDRRAAGREWRELAVALRESRTGVAILEPPAVRPAPEEAPEEQRAPAEAEVARTREARTPLRDRVFAHLADHPDGVRLIEIEREFGLGRLQASRLVGSLIEEGKAAKRDRFYFAT